MKCLRCGSETQVLETRDQGLYIVRRRRECLKCKYRFTTYEKVAPLKIMVEKRNGQKERFSQSKLERGLRKALTKRPVSEEEFQDLIEKIKDEIKQKNEKVISSREIGKIIIEHLRCLDQIAYLRFASVYRGFGSLKTFEKEIKKLKQQKCQRN
ncbi:transcriptional repressor NrdR [bacterium]|nr:transcriptional repressor NrdR [bacterium]